MVDERFSAEVFAACGLDTDEARKLADLLADEIQREMHAVIMAHFQAIIKKLNAMGHHLRPYGEPKPGDISFRDDSGGDCGYNCKLRVSLDSVVSTGYAHVVTW